MKLLSMKEVRIHKSYLILFVVLAVLVVFYSALSAEILSVDDEQLFTYLFNLDSWSFKGLFAGGGSGYYYRPLIGLSWYVDKYLWGPHESFMHLENILLHVANSILVFSITDKLAERYKMASTAAPLAASLIFGLHPLTTEPVNWISGRTDVLAALFILCAMLLLVKGLAKNSVLLDCGAACLFLVGTLAKETALFWFPAALFFVYCCTRENDNGSSNSATRSIIVRLRPYLLLSLVPVCYFVLRHLAFRKGDGAISLAVQGATAGNYDILNKLRITLKVFGFYIKKLVLPLPLNFATVSVSNWYVPVGIAGLLLCCWLFYRRSVVGALLLMASCIIAPALLVPLGRMAWTPVAERYLYMPLAFVVMALVVFVARGSVRNGAPANAVVALIALVITVSGYATYRRNLIWQHNLTLFQDCVAKSPDCAPAKNELARALQSSGRYEEAKRIFITNSVPETDKFRIVSEINRANFMAADKDIDGAIAHLLRLHYSNSQPLYEQYLQSLVDLYGKLQATKQDRASQRLIQLKQIELVKELQEHSGDPYLLYRIGQLYVSVKDMQNAATYFQLAADKAPENAFYKGPAQKLANRLRKQE